MPGLICRGRQVVRGDMLDDRVDTGPCPPLQGPHPEAWREWASQQYRGRGRPRFE